MNCNQSLGYPGNTLGFIPDHAKQQTRIGVKRPFVPEHADVVVVEDNIKQPHFHPAYAKQTLGWQTDYFFGGHVIQELTSPHPAILPEDVVKTIEKKSITIVNGLINVKR